MTDNGRKQLDQLFMFHAISSLIIGFICFLLPHSLVTSSILGHSNQYAHFTHELFRLYGALTLAQGWLVYKTRLVSNAMIRRTFCQAYCLCFTLQTITIIRAQVASPESHSIIINILYIILMGGIASGYGYFLYFSKIKSFELPGNNDKL